MNDTHFSKLVSKLYTLGLDQGDKMQEVVEEIEELKDSIFLYPLYDAYIRFQKESISHYFLSAIASIGSADSLKVLKRILHDKNTRIGSIQWLIGIFNDLGVEDGVAVSSSYDFIFSYSENPNDFKSLLDGYELDELSTYYIKFGVAAKLSDPLQKIWINDTLLKDIRATALRHYLRIESKTAWDFIETSFDVLDDDGRAILAKEINGWRGGRIEKLKVQLAEGGGQAATILEKLSDADVASKKADQIKEESDYPDAKIVHDIWNLKTEINVAAIANPKLGCKLLSSKSALITQMAICRDKESLMARCSELREIIAGVDEALPDSGLNFEQKKQIKSQITETTAGGSLNKIFFLLRARGFDVPLDLFGILKLYRLSGLIGAHQSAEAERINLLKYFNLEQYYVNSNWQDLKRELLLLYKTQLEGLYEQIKN
jgi:hypothetical protein